MKTSLDATSQAARRLALADPSSKEAKAVRGAPACGAGGAWPCAQHAAGVRAALAALSRRLAAHPAQRVVSHRC
jgi:hypothetical protein